MYFICPIIHWVGLFAWNPVQFRQPIWYCDIQRIPLEDIHSKTQAKCNPYLEWSLFRGVFIGRDNRQMNPSFEDLKYSNYNFPHFYKNTGLSVVKLKHVYEIMKSGLIKICARPINNCFIRLRIMVLIEYLFNTAVLYKALF